MPFTSIYPIRPYPLYTVGTTASLSINANSKGKDGAAAVIDKMMTQQFLIDMTKQWPGYWGVPVNKLDVDPNQFTGLSKAYILAIQDMIKAVNDGRFGYFTATFFPPATQQEFINIDTVWLGTTPTKNFLAHIDEVFAGEKAKGMVPPIPKPGS